MSGRPEDGVTIKVIDDPDFAGLVLDVDLSEEDLAQVKAHAEQGRSIDDVRLFDPDLYDRLIAALLAALGPADEWGVADDVQLRNLMAGGGDV